MLATSILPLLGVSLALAQTAAQTVSDGWYTLQSGKLPFGYYREIIEKRGDTYSYRYNLTRVEGGEPYRENIGAVAKADLTPVAFNLNKSGKGALETVNATYTPRPHGGQMTLEVRGSRVATFKRAVGAGAILDVFLPIYFAQRWNTLAPGSKGVVQVFAEDPARGDFGTRPARFLVKGNDAQAGCTDIHISTGGQEVDWCMTRNGVVQTIRVGQFLVRKVSGEAAAKDFAKSILPDKN